MIYQITLNKKAINVLEKINEPYYSNIKESIYKLSSNPRPSGWKKLKGKEGYRIRVANYRIIYDIFDNILTINVMLSDIEKIFTNNFNKLIIKYFRHQ